MRACCEEGGACRCCHTGVMRIAAGGAAVAGVRVKKGADRFGLQAGASLPGIETIVTGARGIQSYRLGLPAGARVRFLGV